MKIIILRFPKVPESLCETIYFMTKRLGYDVEGFVSFDQDEKMTSLDGHPVYDMMNIYNLSWDVAVYAYPDEDFETIRARLIRLNMGTDDQFKNVEWLLQQLMIKKYEDFKDPAIQATIEYWKTNKISVFNQHIDARKAQLNEIFYDEDLPYILFKTEGGGRHKMYFPEKYCEVFVVGGKKIIGDILGEQQPTSPHLYVTDKHKVHAGDIVIDAGVCEGNFALRYIDICSKIYLFEPDEKWQEPLRRTFKDFQDKVEFIPKFVSDVTEGRNITLDDALPDLRGKNIFLKMDVEGAEPRALRGAKNLLTNNKVRASVCTYHNADDLVKVKSIFQSFGYKTSTSAGYMVFLYDPKIFETADFRKGVVYAEN